MNYITLGQFTTRMLDLSGIKAAEMAARMEVSHTTVGAWVRSDAMAMDKPTEVVRIARSVHYPVVDALLMAGIITGDDLVDSAAPEYMSPRTVMATAGRMLGEFIEQQKEG